MKRMQPQSIDQEELETRETGPQESFLQESEQEWDLEQVILKQAEQGLLCLSSFSAKSKKRMG